MKLKFEKTTYPKGYTETITFWARSDSGLLDTKGRTVGDLISIVPDPNIRGWVADLDADGAMILDDKHSYKGGRPLEKGKFAVRATPARNGEMFGSASATHKKLFDSFAEAEKFANEFAVKRADMWKKKDVKLKAKRGRGL